MKRLPQFRNLKRLSVLNKPTKVTDITDADADEYDDKWLLKAEKIEVKRLRNWRQQLAS